MTKRFKITADEADERLDKYITVKLPELSRSHTQKLIVEGNIKVNGRVVKPSHKTVIGDEFDITVPPETAGSLEPQDIPLNISAVGAEQLEEQGLGDISELMAYVPGINVADQGGRDGNRIVVRGLNADPIFNAFGQEDGRHSRDLYWRNSAFC